MAKRKDWNRTRHSQPPDVREALDLLESIERSIEKDVSDKQLSALQNMERGVRKWCHDD